MNTAPEAEALFSELVERHGGSAGIDRLSGLDREIISIVVKLLIEMRSAPPEDVAKSSSTVAQLVATLPQPMGTDDADTFSLTRLDDSELNEFQRLLAKGRDQTTPEWEPEPPPAAPEMGACETRALALGRYLDQHCHEWRGRNLTESERIDVMNLAGDISYPAGFILRNVWEPLWRSERDAAVTAAVIAEQDRLTRVAKAADEHPINLAGREPEPEPMPNNVFDLPLPRIKPFGDFE